MEWEEPEEDEVIEEFAEPDPYAWMTPVERRRHMKLDWRVQSMQIEIAANCKAPAGKMWAVAKFRRLLEAAAEADLEYGLFWKTLGGVSEGEERLDAFTRAVACYEVEKALRLLRDEEWWFAEVMMAECLYEIARHHAKDGKRALARDFLTRAAPPLNESDRLRAKNKLDPDDCLRKKMERLSKKLRWRE